MGLGMGGSWPGGKWARGEVGERRAGEGSDYLK
jgi:hypothetical protein